MQNWEYLLEKLKQNFEGFEIRESQLKMLQDVFSAYEEEKILLVEAGTGTGKTLAYLIPAILWSIEKKEPTVIATHTIALQEQLFYKDIPFIKKALQIEIDVVLAKGMHNYLCLRKFHESSFSHSEELHEWVRSDSCEGERSRLSISSSEWHEVAMDRESCTHVKCPYYRECFFFRARKKIETAQVILTNHHLLFADLAIKEKTENVSFIFPVFKRLILDEAHHVEEAATENLATKVSKKELRHIFSRLFTEGKGKISFLKKKIAERYPEGDFRELLDLYDELDWKLSFQKQQLVMQIDTFFSFVNQEFPEISRLLPHHFDSSFWKEKLQPAAKELCETGKGLVLSLQLLEEKVIRLDPLLKDPCQHILMDIKGFASKLQEHLDCLEHFVCSSLEKEKVRWVEKEQLVSANLDISQTLSRHLFEKIPTVVLCSATLTANQDFTFIKKRLGIEEAKENCYPSPFDYAKQTFLAQPNDFPDPTHPHFALRAAAFIRESIEISQGNAFVLFTSHTMLRECEQLVKEDFALRDYPLLCQSDENKNDLLGKFRETKKAVLFGTDSFWEGVDVSGEALQLVIIVKLPFKSPQDPLFQARCEKIENDGKSAFFHFALPEAIVKFKQGFGRLIRNQQDKGCIVCLDPRLGKKGYGKQFLKSLPSCTHIFATEREVKENLRRFYQKK